MRIDYLSPLPPVRSGISDYSLDLLPHLEPLCDLRVVRLPGQPVTPEVEARWRPVPLTQLSQAPGEGPLPLYQMGNNRHHEGVIQRALTHPGVLTLHDLVLHHLLLDLTLGRESGEAALGRYAERLAADHGWMGEPVARAKFWGAWGEAPTFAFPAHRTLIRRQRGVLVHSRWAAEALAHEEPEVRLRAVPMGVPLPAAADRTAGLAFRRRRGLPEDHPVVGCFGFQTPIKRTLSVVRALASPGLAGAHLLVVGEVSPALDLETEARRLGVAERVHVTGFVDFEEFESAIAAADLCINLRYPSAGETSASLLRILAAGRPAVVSEHAQFAELPAEIAVAVPLGDEEAPALAARLPELLDDPERLAAMGDAAREHVRRYHDPARAAAAVIDACREWAHAEPPGDAPVRVPPPTTLAWSRLAGGVVVTGLEGWKPGERRRLAVRLTNGGPATWLAGESGPGGVAVEARLLTPEGEDLEADRPWKPLPRDVAAGEAVELGFDLRRPPGAVRLVVEPHVLGGFGFSALGGPVWSQELGDG